MRGKRYFNIFTASLFALALSFAIHPSLSVASSSLPTTEVELVTGSKFPNTPDEGQSPVTTAVLAPVDEQKLAPTGYTDLVPYMLASPNQTNAGSCLYMSLTGMAEFWFVRQNPEASRAPDGPLDLSERYMMNLARDRATNHQVANWKTDSIYLLNSAGGTMLNHDYRFTKGWYYVENGGHYGRTPPNSKGASYGTPYNWIDDRPTAHQTRRVRLPVLERDVIFADPESNQWNTGVMPDDIVERIKDALVRNQAPVQIIYNHFGYWHSTLIVGFDDTIDNRNCQFVHSFLNSMKAQAQTSASTGTDATAALRNRSVYEKTLNAYRRGGGCHPKGTFYVRDSIYSDPKAPIYTYDPANPDGNAPYSKRIVLLEYDWVRYMANHAIQIRQR